MDAEQAVSWIEGYRIPMNPGRNAVLPGLLSLFVPGLGQAWLGQWSRGMRVFAASATLCFGLGFANLLTAYDAFSLARRNQEGDITARTSSKTLLLFSTLWTGFCMVLDSFIDGMARGPGVLIAFPLMFVSYLAGGKGFSR